MNEPKKTFEEIVGAPGPVGGSRSLKDDDGRRPSWKAISRSDGRIITVDELTDPSTFDPIPGGAQ